MSFQLLARRRPLMRVVVDSHLRLPLTSRVAQTANHDVLVFCSFAEEKKKQQLVEHGIQVEQVAMAGLDGRPELAAICRRLAEREITSVMIEGGALVNWAALASGVADKIFFYYAPKILGGNESLPMAGGVGRRRRIDAIRLRDLKLHSISGDEFAVEGYVQKDY